MELENFKNWLYIKHNIDISLELKEYIGEIYTKDDVMKIITKIYDVQYESLFIDTKKGKRKSCGPNIVPIARGHLVKALLSNKIENFKCTNVYMKLFGIHRDHSTAIHYNQMEFIGYELKQYKQLENFILTNKIQWN